MNKNVQLKNLILCADDYAQSEAISAGILQLVEKGRLSAVSCMVNEPLWQTLGPKLIPYRNHIDIGLHLNLTDGRPLTSGSSLQRQGQYLPFTKLIARSFAGQINLNDIKLEIAAQLNRFNDVMGFLPDFIDGHRHTHLLPTIQPSLLLIYGEYYPDKSAYIRLPSHSLWSACRQFYNFPKAGVIHLLGAYRLKKQLLNLNIPFNRSFAGIYRFQQHGRFAHYFQQFLHHSQSNGIVMCHPGFASRNEPDVLHQSRVAELNYLMSEEFTQLLQQHNWQLSKFR